MKIGYARVSTDDQNTAAQLDELRAAGCDRIIEEKASSRRKLALRDAMLQELNAGDRLIVWRFDRLARSTVDLLNIVADLEARGVQIESLRDKVDTSTPHGRALFAISSVFAQLERDLISERTKAGMQAKKRAGVHVGRPRALTSQQVDLATRMLSEGGGSLRSVAAAFKVSHSTLLASIARRKLDVHRQNDN